MDTETINNILIDISSEFLKEDYSEKACLSLVLFLHLYSISVRCNDGGVLKISALSRSHGCEILESSLRKLDYPWTNTSTEWERISWKETPFEVNEEVSETWSANIDAVKMKLISQKNIISIDLED